MNFKQEVAERINVISQNETLKSSANRFMEASLAPKYSHTGNNPKTAAWEYLKAHPEFEIDKSIQQKLQITVAPDGYLKRIN